MSKLDYDLIFNQAFQKIKQNRDPRAERPEVKDLNWHKVKDQEILDFGGKDFVKATSIVEKAKRISISFLMDIFITLFKEIKKYNAEEKEYRCDKDPSFKVCFSIYVEEIKELLIFKELESNSIFLSKSVVPQSVQDNMREIGATSYKYIYFVYDYAFLQVIGYDNNDANPGEKYKVFSIKDFFVMYFGIDEYTAFIEHLKQYTYRVKEYLGFTVLKTLNPTTKVNFKKIVEHSLFRFDYSKVKQKKYFDKNQNKEISITDEDYQKIKQQYIEKMTCLAMLGNHDYAESLITAEWLNVSMKKAEAIDLTVIGMGYFKSIEQLLYALICLHRNQHRAIKRMMGKKVEEEMEKAGYIQKPYNRMIVLDDISIEKEWIDSSLGSMAHFYEDYRDVMLRRDIDEDTREVIKRYIFNFKDLRNGYFHKNNIHDPEKIKEIQEITYIMAFLLLGGQNLSNDELKILGVTEETKYNDYYRLCEYVNYHAGEPFFLYFGADTIVRFDAYIDKFAKVSDSGAMIYSGVYFVMPDGLLYRLNESGAYYIHPNTWKCSKMSDSCIPSKISLAKLVPSISETEEISVEIVEHKTIMENGKYLGPSIVEEEGFDY